jgi:integrase
MYTEADGTKTLSKTWIVERIFTRLGNVGQAEAENWLHDEIERKVREQERQKSSRCLFAEYAVRYLKGTQNKASIESISIHIVAVVPFISHLEVQKIHDGTLEKFREARLADGVKPSTINRALEVVRTILNKAARVYRDDEGMPWLKQAPPVITMLEESPRLPYPLSWDEQSTLFKLLPKRLRNMVLFAVNSGLRDENVCGSKWAWEVIVPELGRSVFVIPPEIHKTGKRTKRPLVVILNNLA